MTKEIENGPEDVARKVLGEPYPLQLSEYEERVRRNLLLYSVVSISACMLGAVSVNEPVLFGVIKLPRFSSEVIYAGLLMLVFYELLNYGLMLWNSFSYWRVRLTGSRLRPSRSTGGPWSTGGEEFEDVDGEEKNSTIYIWMFERAYSAESILNALNERSIQLDEICVSLKRQQDMEGCLGRLEVQVKMMNDSLKAIDNILSSARLSESFNRYDRWFYYMIKTQSVRWLVLDCAIPLLLGLIAFSLLCISMGDSILVLYSFPMDGTTEHIDAIVPL